MLFLVIFGSLAAAMAIVAQGNLRTADSSLKVSRAQSAAESGLVFAQRRLETQAKRFVITKGVVDPDFAERLWMGDWMGSDGTVSVLPPVGYNAPDAPDGIAAAVRDAHLADAFERAGAALLRDIPGLTITMHVAADFGSDPLAAERARQDIAQANIVVCTQLFQEEYANAVYQAVLARRDAAETLCLHQIVGSDKSFFNITTASDP